jgi:hypothetical protein
MFSPQHRFISHKIFGQGFSALPGRFFTGAFSVGAGV